MLVEIHDDVVALDMNGSVMDQNGHKSTGIDSEKPRFVVPLFPKVNDMRLPWNTLYVQHDTHLLRTAGGRVVKDVYTSPTKDFTSLYVTISKLDHCGSRSTVQRAM